MHSVRRSFLSTLRNFKPVQQAHLKHTLPALPYEYNALEPVISKQIMELHHTKHHQAYVNNLNVAEEELNNAIKKNDISSVIKLQSALKFNGGGHINHSIFWNNLTPKTTKLDGELLTAVEKSFGNLESLKTKLTTAANGVQGSGWGWLAYNKAADRLEVATTPNQDPLFPTTGLFPLIGIDVWEHAYYLQYLNVRADYTKAVFDIINWDDVKNRYAEAKKK